ncbi:MAG: hypothetical protein CSA68_02425 [Rhodobacterales bacterium]|nr:MAG: hypothetical protein CSA68_02425 [Rhodobacterales bacterium]
MGKAARMGTAMQMDQVQDLPVYLSDDFRVVDGAALGDGLADGDDLILDDAYALRANAGQHRLSIFQPDRQANSAFVIDAGSTVGVAGHELHLDCTITLMGPDGETFDAVVLVEVDPEAGVIEQVYMLALAPVREKTSYHLVGIDQSNAQTRMAQAACVSFSRGTHITMASGEQRPIEDLRVGDKVLTRDQGPQTIRWIGQTTMRAVGEFAPVLIKKSALNNLNDLVVSPNHRLFIYQRIDEIGAGRSEVLVKAKHLINGTTVTRVNGGFVDYFQLLFDEHQIIFAEGIAAESLLLDMRTSAVLPADLACDIYGSGLVDHRNNHNNFEVDNWQQNGGDVVERLRRASCG